MTNLEDYIATRLLIALAFFGTVCFVLGVLVFWGLPKLIQHIHIAWR